METVLIENAISYGPKDCSTPKHCSDRPERSHIPILQDSTNGSHSSADGGKERFENKDENKPKVKILFDKGNSTSSSHTIKIFEDNSPTEDGHSVRCSRLVQTDDSLLESYLQNKHFQNVNVSTDSGHLSGCFDQEAYDLMVNENVPENYWKQLAEQRREALNETLEENEKLSFEVEQLKEENRRLSDIASKAEYLQSLLQEALADEQGDENADDLNAQKIVSSGSDNIEADHISGGSAEAKEKKDAKVEIIEEIV